MRVLGTLLLALLLSLPGLVPPARAQAPRIVRHLSVAEGLAHRVVHCLYQDRAGFLWIGTDNGLDRFDGYEIQSFARLTGRTLPNPAVRAVVEDASGRLWLGTTGGLYTYDPARRRLAAVQLADAATLAGISSLALSRTGDVWAGTLRGEIVRLRQGRLVSRTRLTGEAGRMISTVLSLHPQPDDGVLAASHSGALVHLAPDGRIRQVFRLPGTALRYAGPEPGGGVRMAGLTGFYRAAADDPTATPRLLTAIRTRVPGSARTLCTLTDRWGMLWLGTDQGELLRYNPLTGRLDSLGTAIVAVLGQPLRIRVAFEDKGGNVWLGTNLGVVQLDNQRPRFATPAPPPALWEPDALQFSTRGMAEMPDGSLFVGSYAGLFRRRPAGQWERVRWREHGHERGILAYGLWPDRATGHLWVATEGTGLLRYDPATDVLTHCDSATVAAADRAGLDISRLYNHATCLTADRRGRLWMGSYAGLRLYERPTGRLLAQPDGPDRRLGVPMLRYSALAPVAGGPAANPPPTAADMWAATELGLFRLTPDGDVRQRWAARPGGLPVNDVLCLWPAPNGRTVWVGTRGGGLARLDVATGRARTWRRADGLADDLVCAVAPEGDSAVWAATQRGLSRLNLRTNHFESFFARDGLAGDEFNHGSVLRLRSGRYLFGGVSGLSEVPPHPPAAGAATAADAPLLLTALSVYDGERLRELSVPHTAAAPLTLPAADGFLSVQFALVDFRESGQHQYAYRLGGRRAPWLPLGPERVLRLAQLPAGRDTLHVRAAGPDGRWSRHELRLPLRVLAPWYLRGWVIGLETLALAALLYGLYRLRMRRALAVERLRTQIAANLHDEVGSLLTRIAVQAEFLNQMPLEPDATASGLRRIATTSRDAIATMSDVVWSIDARQESADALLGRMREHLLHLTTPLGITWALDTPNVPARLVLPLAVRQAVYLIFKESTTNAVRHGQPAHLAVRFGLEDRALHLRVTEEGSGRKSAVEWRSGGQGLRNMQARAAALGGVLTAGPGPTGAWEVALELPLRRSARR